MGKIFDALEKRRNEKAVEALKIPIAETPAKTEKEAKMLTPDYFTQNHLNPKLVVRSAPESFDAETFKILRAQILFPWDGKKARTIMVTSTFPGEGKTHVAANLGVSIAEGVNEHVLLVDSDLRRPNLHEVLGYPNQEGLHEYLIGKRQLPELLIRTRFEKVSLLTAGGRSAQSTELLSSNRMRDFLKEVKERYEDRYVILDGAPSQVAAEVGVLAHYVDGIILTVMAERTPKEAIQRGIETLGKKKVLGIVFNGYKRSDKSYSKYYHKYYKKYHSE